jgi:hypothetical protein
MLVNQGANGPCVVELESDVIVAAMNERAQDVEFLVLEVYKLMVDFLKKY